MDYEELFKVPEEFIEELELKETSILDLIQYAIKMKHELKEIIEDRDENYERKVIDLGISHTDFIDHDFLR